MIRQSRMMRRFLTIVVFAGLATAAFGQTQAAQKPFEPVIGQSGKDVIWVPTNLGLVNKMLDMAKVTAQDFVMDLGSGDGRTVITAAKRGARAMGIEYNPDMVELSKFNAAKEGVGDRAQFVNADLFETDFSKATVITMFLLQDINLKLRPKLLDLKPGTRIVSNTFTMGEWAADETGTAEEGGSSEEDSYASYRTALLWIVPAKAAGTWQMGPDELVLAQNFQTLEGTLKRGGKSIAISNGGLRGDQIHFSAGDAEYSGTVNGSRMHGIVKTGNNSAEWTAELRSAPKN